MGMQFLGNARFFLGLQRVELDPALAHPSAEDTHTGYNAAALSILLERALVGLVDISLE